MKINPIDAHDRYTYLTQQSFSISECCQDLVDQRPFGDYPFYIFAHARTEDDGINKRLIWQPRLTRPKAQTNSMLFKAFPGTDIIKVIWMIPDRCMWAQFRYGTMMQNKTVCESIEAFEKDRNSLERNDPEDLDDEQINAVYREVSNKARHAKQVPSEESSTSPLVSVSDIPDRPMI